MVAKKWFRFIYHRIRCVLNKNTLPGDQIRRRSVFILTEEASWKCLTFVFDVSNFTRFEFFT